MKFIKPILFGLAGLFIVITLISLLMPSRITLVRSVLIQATPERVMQQVEDPGNWKNWNPLIQLHCTDAIYSSGEMHCRVGGDDYLIRKIYDSSAVIHFDIITPGHPVTHYRFFKNEPKSAKGIELHWQVETRLRWYPWEKFSGIFFSETAGPGYEQALQALKQFCEKQETGS